MKLSHWPRLMRVIRALRIGVVIVVGVLGGMVGSASAHDIRVPLQELREGVTRVQGSLEQIGRRPLDRKPRTLEAQRWELGRAEVEFAIGNGHRALGILLARLGDPDFQRLPVFADALLMASEILATLDDEVGSMSYAEAAIQHGRTPQQVAEAGLRWFRLARRYQRIERRPEVLRLWESRGGLSGAKPEMVAEVRYEAAFAMRSLGAHGDARQVLAQVPSGSAFGSRAAYLSGVILVEQGDLSKAEQWFEAVAGWPIAAHMKDEAQLEIEKDVRGLASLSLGRLRFERGDLKGADAAYRTVPADSPALGESCWERAFLDLERLRRRGALKNIQCVVDVGASRARRVEAQLFLASLYAHMGLYGNSLGAYRALQDEVLEEAAILDMARGNIEHPAEFLFGALERTAVGLGAKASPGPATLFGDAWDAHVDHSYRLDRGIGGLALGAASLLGEVEALEEALSGEAPFHDIELRRFQLQHLLLDAQHLVGHAGQLEFDLSNRVAGPIAGGHDHKAEVADASQLGQRLRSQLTVIEQALVELEATEQRRLMHAMSELKALRRSLVYAAQVSGALAAQLQPLADDLAGRGLAKVQEAVRGAHMKAEAGVLDSFWLKKEHTTKKIEALLRLKDEAERQMDEALLEMAEDDEIPEVDPTAFRRPAIPTSQMPE